MKACLIVNRQNIKTTFQVCKVLVFIGGYALFSIIAGCTPHYELIEKTKYVYIPIPKNLTQVIVPLTPPDRSEYISATQEERTNLLLNYSINLLETSRNLNDRLVSIEKLDTEHARLIDETNKKEEERVAKLMGEKIKLIKGEK